MILLFQVIGYLALVDFDQGIDVLRTLSFSEAGISRVHAWTTFFAVLWWSWQSWRSARVQLHFTNFDFSPGNERYATRAQVLIPRVLGVIPILIFTYGLYKASGWNNPVIFLYISLAFWMYIFFHLRKDIMVYIKSKHLFGKLRLQDYVMIKPEAYPAKFIWAKQGSWIIFRLFVIISFFTFIVVYPVRFPQQIGASAIVLFALGSWLVVGTFLDFAEKHYRFPFVFTLILMVTAFSFINNNHEIRTLDSPIGARHSIDEHFVAWVKKRQMLSKDTIPVVLMGVQGGGVRSAYWTAQVMAELQNDIPEFSDHTYAYSSVSGGTLGVAAYRAVVRNQVDKDASQMIHDVLSQDFLSPVTSWLVVPDLVQKFLPFPIGAIDRAKALEYSWEYAGYQSGYNLFSGGFLSATKDDECLYFYNSTHAENGFTTLISNAVVDNKVFSNKEDFFSVVGTDVPQSTAISVSSRFPFLTPPALVKNKNGEKWGHLVDGGYVDNLGANTILELYDHLRLLSTKSNLKTKFFIVFVKNTKEEYSTPINGLYEIRAPLNAFSKVWVNSGSYVEGASKLKNLRENDEAMFITLDRRDDELIPLGWYLSEKSISNIEDQLEEQTEVFKSSFGAYFER